MLHLMGRDQATLCGQSAAHRFQTTADETVFSATKSGRCKRCWKCVLKLIRERDVRAFKRIES